MNTFFTENFWTTACEINSQGIFRNMSNIYDQGFWKGSKWDEVFKSELSKFCGRQPLKNLLSLLLNTLSQIWIITELAFIKRKAGQKFWIVLEKICVGVSLQ